jgi:hypothetical protein
VESVRHRIIAMAKRLATAALGIEEDTRQECMYGDVFRMLGMHEQH